MERAKDEERGEGKRGEGKRGEKTRRGEDGKRANSDREVLCGGKEEMLNIHADKPISRDNSREMSRDI